MSYQRTMAPLGASVSDVAAAATQIVQDPCLFKVTDLVLKLKAASATSGALGASGSERGIGLCKAVTPLRMAVYVKSKPWLIPLAGAGVVGGLVALGWWLRGSSK